MTINFLRHRLIKYLLLTLLVWGGTFVLSLILGIFSYVGGLALGDLSHLDVVSASALPFLIPPIAGLILILYIVQKLRLKRKVQTGVVCLFCISLLTTGQLLNDFSHHRPPINVAPGVEMRMIDQANWSIGARKSLQSGLEIDGDLAYEILGWADAKTLVYRRWCGKGSDKTKPTANAEAYHLDTGQQNFFVSMSNSSVLSALSRKTCPYESCIQPLLTISAAIGRDGRPVYPSRF